MNELLCIQEEVQDGLNEGKPIVALESTIISHGMPYPDNLTTAKACETLVRRAGAIPATIALHQGQIHIGLSDELLHHFANEKTIQKASKRDLSYVISQKLSASTTVSATLYLASLAGLSFFATGGIGGVHHGVSSTYDISCDLTELSQVPITLVCAGAKAILDLAKTLEVLETLGVPVIGYQSDTLPAFYSHTSPYRLSMRLDSPQEIAHLIQSHRKLELLSAILITNPIPKAYEIPFETIEPKIAEALERSKALSGPTLTPFLLKTIAELTESQSLKANIELVKNNAYLAGQIASAYQAIA